MKIFGAVMACEGTRAAGATEVYLRDAHETARNLDVARIPSGVRIIRGWSGHPYKMVHQWKRSLLKRAAGIFERGGKATAAAEVTEETVRDLHAKIGELAVANDVL